MKYEGIYWLTDEKYAHAKWSLGRNVEAAMDCFKMHGMNVFIPGAVRETVKL